MFKLSITTPEKVILKDVLIEEAIVPAYRGELNILPGHAPLMSTLSTGILQYISQETKEKRLVAISWGYLEVYPGGINILAETAEIPTEINIERAKEAEKKALEKLEKGSLEKDEIVKYQTKIYRAIIRQIVAKNRS